MKTAPLLFAATLLISSFAVAAGDSQAITVNAPRAYRVVGEWQVKHPAWSGSVLLLADGTLIAPNQAPNGGADKGRWTLASFQGTPLLVVAWNNWGTEALEMIDPDYFRGQIEKDSFMEMRRSSVEQ
jgi:acyl dehydratase